MLAAPLISACLLAQRLQAAAHLHRAGQRMADDVLGQWATSISLSRSMPVSMPISSSMNTGPRCRHCRGALVRGERAAAQAGDGGVEDARCPSPVRHRRWRSPCRACRADAATASRSGKRLAHLADHAPDRFRRRPGHGVGEREHLRLHAVLGGDVEQCCIMSSTR